MMNACPRWSFLAVPLLAALGCSDPVPLPAQGAISLSIQKPLSNVNGSSCPESGATYQVGGPGIPSTTSTGDSVIDGDNGAKISCSVKGSGPYTFSGSFHGTTPDGNHYPITVSFSSGTVDKDGVNGTVAVSVFTPVLAANFSSTDACTVTVLNKQIKGGSIWAKFSCPSITNPPSGLCRVGDSVIVFENCDGS